MTHISTSPGIRWRILNDTAENVVEWIAEKDRRIAELEAQINEIKALPDNRGTITRHDNQAIVQSDGGWVSSDELRAILESRNE